MRRTLILIITIFFNQVTISQIKGRIIDIETSKGVEYANLFLVNIGTGATTNEKGEFIIDNDIPNHNKLKISALGYSDVIIEIDELTNRENLIIKLTSKHYHLHEAIISSGTGVLYDYAITPVASKPLKELNVIANTNLGESIANLEGVYNASIGKGIFKPVIRGLSGIRVLSFFNGVRLENQQWGSDHGLGVSSIGIGQVEVIKGPSSLLYGADALGGVLYLKEESYAKSNSIEVDVNSQFETNTKGINNGFAFKLSKKNFRFNVFGNQQNYADYETPDSKFVKSSRFKGVGTKILIGYNKKKWVSNLGYNFSNNTIGIPGHTHDTLVTASTFLRTNQVREEGRPSQKIQNHLFSFDNQFFFHKSNLKITLGQMLNTLAEYEKFTIPEIGTKLSTSTYYLRYTYKVSKKINVITGAQGLYQQNTNLSNAEEELIPNNSQLENGIFGILTGEIHKLNYQLGVRFDNKKIDLLSNQNKNFNYNSFNYSVGLGYGIKDLSFSLNLSSGTRNPHVSELLSEGGHSAAQRYEIGDANLNPEIGNQLDFSVKYKNEHLDILVNPFINILKNYIFLDPVDSSVNGFQVFDYKQAENAIITGGELVFHYHPHFLHDFHLESVLSYVYGQTEKSTPLPRMPQPRLSNQVVYNFDNEKKRKFSLKNITVQHQFFDKQNRTSSFELKSNNYTLFNTGLNSSLLINKSIIELGLGVNNVFNQAYIDHLSGLKTYQVQNPGRNYYVSIKFNINQKIK